MIGTERLYGMLLRLEVTEDEYKRRVIGVMSGDEFVGVHKKMRDYLCQIARKLSKLPEEQEDLIQEACLRIAENSADRSISFLEAEAYRAMEAAYRRYLRRSTRGISKEQERKIQERRRKIIGEIKRRQKKKED